MSLRECKQSYVKAACGRSVACAIIVFPMILVTVCVLSGLAPRVVGAQPRFRTLVFSGTADFRHESIPAGVEAVRDLGVEFDFAVDATEDPSIFAADSLDAYDVVVFLNTSGDVLNDRQQSGLETYVRAGGGFAGIHGAAATEYEWEWYGRLVGAFFDNHPEPQTAAVEIMDRAHPSTRDLPVVWERFDEWYNFRTNPRGDVHVLAVLEESSYEGGEMGHDHPIAWVHEFDGGRAWYTGLGHTVEGYADEAFRDHLLGGIEWAADIRPGDAGATMASRFEKVVLMPEVTDPMEMGIDGRGRVFVAERSGPVKMWDPETSRTTMVGFVPVRMTIEDGLLGLTLDPGFEENGWIYLYYAPADGGPQRLARQTFDGERLDPATEKILLEIPTQQRECCHSGGSLTFGPDGHLYLSTGDNTNPYPLGGSAMDQRAGFSDGDAQRTSASTNDLRGKILRIRPLPDGSYSVPEDNLFEGDSLHRPEIYTMGHRNPYRISVDPQTGWLYWGDVGIGNAPSEERGPWGWEEFNQAREPGFYGWPYFAGPNDAYREYDYATETAGAYFDPEAPLNDSPNNTGAQALTPAREAMIWYTYGRSEEFPEMGSGGMSAMAGPVYRYDPETASPNALPAYYDGSFLIYEWMRHWVLEVKFEEDGRVLEINPFPGMDFVRPTEMEVGPDGRLYVIEWGETFWGSNDDAQVVRIDYLPDGRDATAGLEEAAPPGEQTALSIRWPPTGGIFEYGTPIPYEVSGARDAVVRPYSGHDTHEHPLEPVRGVRGDLVITDAFTHVPDLHYVDRYAVLEAGPLSGGESFQPPGAAEADSGAGAAEADSGAAAAGTTRAAFAGPVDRVVLRPRVVEAEHASEIASAERQTVGKHPAEPDFAEAALTVMQVEAEGRLGYAPLNLTGIDTLVIRVKPMVRASIEVRRDDPDGPSIATVEVDSTAGRPVRDVSLGGRRTGTLHGRHLPELPEGVRESYHGWRDVAVPVSDVGATTSLHLLVRSEAADGIVLRIDRLEFVGAGIMQRPD